MLCCARMVAADQQSPATASTSLNKHSLHFPLTPAAPATPQPSCRPTPTCVVLHLADADGELHGPKDSVFTAKNMQDDPHDTCLLGQLHTRTHTHTPTGKDGNKHVDPALVDGVWEMYISNESTPHDKDAEDFK